MFEVVKVIHRAIPLKTADILRRTYIGPKGRGNVDRLMFASRGPHDINGTIRDHLMQELRSAGFVVNLDTYDGAGHASFASSNSLQCLISAKTSSTIILN